MNTSGVYRFVAFFVYSLFVLISTVTICGQPTTKSRALVVYEQPSENDGLPLVDLEPDLSLLPKNLSSYPGFYQELLIRHVNDKFRLRSAYGKLRSAYGQINYLRTINNIERKLHAVNGSLTESKTKKDLHFAYLVSMRSHFDNVLFMGMDWTPNFNQHFNEIKKMYEQSDPKNTKHGYHKVAWRTDKCKVPIIEFNKDDGRIFIPTSSKGSIESDKCMAQFKFNVDSNVAMQGQQGRFECIQHKRGSKHLIKFGQLKHRLWIHANEDVFEKTKNRMAAIELEQRKNCTREIDWNVTSGINRKVRIDRSTKPPQLPSTTEPPPAPAPASIATAKITNTVPILNRSSKLAPCLDNFDNRLNKSSTSSSPSPSLPKTTPNPTNTTKAKNTRTRQTNAALKSTSTNNPAIMKRPLKERIIHMLAIRPHKKLELFAALRRDGLRESDKSHLMHTLVSVSTLRDNTYQLLRHVWNDIQEDWPFYTEQERQQMKRNKPQNLTPPSSDSGISVGSNQSPNSSSFSSGDKSPSCQYKRPGYFHGVDGLQTKRHRISHYSRPSKPHGGDDNVGISPSTITNDFDEVIEKSGLSSTAVKNPPLRPNYRYGRSIPMEVDPSRPSKELNNTKSVPDRATNSRNTISSVTKTDTKDLNIVPHSDMYNSANKEAESAYKNVGKIKNQPHDRQSNISKSSSSELSNTSASSKNTSLNPTSSSVSPLPLRMSQMKLPDDNCEIDYEKEYTTITNLDQRKKYKSDFYSIFGEYKPLEDKVTSVTKMFTELGDSLRQCEKGSSEFKRIESKIVARYQSVKEDENYQLTKRRCEFLYKMLSHIKQLVEEYDEKCCIVDDL